MQTARTIILGLLHILAGLLLLVITAAYLWAGPEISPFAFFDRTMQQLFPFWSIHWSLAACLLIGASLLFAGVSSLPVFLRQKSAGNK